MPVLASPWRWAWRCPAVAMRACLRPSRRVASAPSCSWTKPPPRRCPRSSSTASTDEALLLAAAFAERLERVVEKGLGLFLGATLLHVREEIGRASCRERACQYV